MSLLAFLYINLLMPLFAAPSLTPMSQTIATTQERTTTGSFTVKMTPVSAQGEAVGRYQLDKTFQGGIEGTGSGQMLTVMTSVEGSAGYVAMEVVTGTLDGRKGTFALQHRGVMDRGAQALSISVVPDSGTGELKGLRGEMSLDLSGGQHKYTFRYTLPD